VLSLKDVDMQKIVWSVVNLERKQIEMQFIIAPAITLVRIVWLTLPNKETDTILALFQLRPA
jgi:hypothetical protein